MTDQHESAPAQAARREQAILLRRVTALKERKADIEAQLEIAQEELDRSLGKGAYTFRRGGRAFQGTVVRGATETVDLEYWRTHSPEIYEQIIKPALDKDAFVRLYEAGAITDEEVKESVIIKPKKSYVLISPVKTEE